MSCLVKRDRMLFQYKSAPQFDALMDNLYSNVDSTALCDLNNFFNIDQASGYWLTQLAAFFNVYRNYTVLGNQFLLDYSNLDTTACLDGDPTPAPDLVVTAILKARLYANTSVVKSIEYIIKQFIDVINPKIFHVIESDKHLDLYIGFYVEGFFFVNLSTINGTDEINGVITPESLQKIYLLAAIRNTYGDKWFGCPSGVSVTYYITGV